MYQKQRRITQQIKRYRIRPLGDVNRKRQRQHAKLNLVEDLSLLANPGEGCLRLSPSRFVDYSTSAYEST